MTTDASNPTAVGDATAADEAAIADDEAAIGDVDAPATTDIGGER